MEKVLHELGLSEKETLTYLKLVELGQASTQRLSEITGINRITLYDILRYLIEKGFVGSTIIENVRYFYATPPKSILGILKEKEKKFLEILPELESKMATITKKPKIQIYEGKKGIDIINEDVLKEKKEIIAYGSFDVFRKVCKWQMIDFLKKRLKLGIKWKGIADSSIKNESFYSDSKYKQLTKLKIDDSLKNMKTWNYIYGNKIAINSMEKDNFVGIIIEDESVNQSHKLIFEKLWRQAR